MSLTRRDTLVLAAAASVASFYGLGSAHAQEVTTVDQAKLMAEMPIADKVIGSATAPVTVVEYASPTCPHCATFHNIVYPEFKAQYIDTGKVRFILRPFVRNVLDAVVFMLAEAAGPEKYHDVVNTYFKTQETWATSQTPRDAILAIAKQLGFTDQSFDAALTNQELFAGMEKMREQALNEFGLTGTPTFYVNNRQLTGEKTLAELAAEIDALVPAGFQPTQAPATQPAAPAADATAPATTPAAPAATTDAPAATPTPDAMAPAAPAQ